MIKVEDKIKALLAQGLDGFEGDIKVDIPKDNQNGDYSTNIAMRLAKSMGQTPRDLAQQIKERLLESDELIEKVEIAGPGFINIWVNKSSLSSIIKQIILEDQAYGNNNSGENLKVNVEYISVNPTGLLHIGHARGASWGDSITRLMTRSNYDVTREYYVNDGGNQIHNLVLSMLERYKQLHGLEYQLPEDGYHSQDVLEIVSTINDKYGKALLEWDQSRQFEVLEAEGVALELNRIKEDLKRFNIEKLP